ncbi:MAG: hypothetical protein FWE62_05860, partial [Firmicutes bacterium]|nr:hypothetical protein [Bacillota bacterium]
MAKSKEIKLYSGGAKAAFRIAFSIFAVYAFIMIFIILWAFLQSLKDNYEFWDDMVSLPLHWRFSNYSTAIEKLSYSDVGFLGMFVNSLWFAVGMSVLSVFMH